MKRCDELKVAAHLMKPVKQSELLGAIEMSLGADVPEKEGVEALPGGPEARSAAAACLAC